MKTLFILLLVLCSSCMSQTEKAIEKILKIKSQKLLQDFNSENKITTSDYDTLIDLNYDDMKDFVIGYYGQSGTGIKNKVKVYLYDFEKQDFILDEQLSNLSNPTFYIDEKKITEFYIGNGGGGGTKLEWINNKWIITKTFEVEKNEIKDVWKVEYPLEKKTEYFAIPISSIPPNEILETRVKE